ncbi:MAG: ATP-binding cassette domain-containing protein [Firmicutes bacterium]|jgi:oligopeptide/dipeptide ABC transporter ATP-binding protein|nr:ATP-binding cassette domain-containing protein [Bacillota bacterium]MDH7494421.1 ATP-binding cassette domain-containing protein [Bacillota bacterium]
MTSGTTNPKPLVSARNLSKHFVLRETLLSRYLAGVRERTVRAVDGVSLDVYPGETLSLVGESGCGKSTLGRTILGLHEPTSGYVVFDGNPVTGPRALPRASIRREAQIIFQNPYSSLNPRHTVRRILGVALAARGVTPRERDGEIEALLRRVGLGAEHADRYPHQFSGGQRQRIAVARALATHPRFVVADEPLSSLDVSVQAQIINLLQELQEEFGLAYLFIAHDLRVVYHISHRVAVMYLGQIVESAPTDELFENPLHPYTQALLSAIPSIERYRRRQRIVLEGTVPTPIDPPRGCRFHPRCPRRTRLCQEKAPELLRIADAPAPDSAAGSGHAGHFVRCHMVLA